MIKEATKKTRTAKNEAALQWVKHTALSTSAPGPAPAIQEGIDTVLHSTHDRWILKEIVFCGKCGCWTGERTGKLAKPCPGEPTFASYKCGLGKMKKGFHPLRTAARPVEWRDCTSGTFAIKDKKLD